MNTILEITTTTMWQLLHVQGDHRAICPKPWKRINVALGGRESNPHFALMQIKAVVASSHVGFVRAIAKLVILLTMPDSAKTKWVAQKSWPVASIMWMQSNTCITMKSSVILMSMKTIIMYICYLQYQIYNHCQNMLRQIATWDSFGWRAVTDTMVLRDIIINYVNQTYSHFNCSNCVHRTQIIPPYFPLSYFFFPLTPQNNVGPPR